MIRVHRFQLPQAVLHAFFLNVNGTLEKDDSLEISFLLVQGPNRPQLVLHFEIGNSSGCRDVFSVRSDTNKHGKKVTVVVKQIREVMDDNERYVCIHSYPCRIFDNVFH